MPDMTVFMIRFDVAKYNTDAPSAQLDGNLAYSARLHRGPLICLWRSKHRECTWDNNLQFSTAQSSDIESRSF
jgi:hypothetical protein